MNKNLIELVLVVDRSGSMQSIASTAVAGFKDFVGGQVVADGDANVSVYTFDERIDRVMYRQPLKSKSTQDTIEKDTGTWFTPRGWTALYDAMGRAANEIGAALAATPEAERPAKVIVVTITDGHENMSKEYTQEAIRELITRQTTQYKWDFIFIGANQDAVLTAQGLGIQANSALTFNATKGGTRGAMESLTRSTLEVRRAYSSFSGVDISDCVASAAFSEEDRAAALDTASSAP